MEKDIINIALNNLCNVAPIKVTWHPHTHPPFDGHLVMEQNNNIVQFAALIKKEMHMHHLMQLMNHPTPNPIMVIAARIQKGAKEKLKEWNIAYIEGNGDAYINNPGLFLLIETNKPLPIQKPTSNRAFTKTGLKVLFYFLLDKELINRPQRDIAAITGVALGNVPLVIEGLKETGYLLKLNRKTYTWENRKELLERWITGYETILKPAITIGTYAMRKPWQEIQLNNELTVWGGEPAADILTNYLRPEKFTLYTNEGQTVLLKDYGFTPDPEGELTVCELFWKQDKQAPTAPPLLVYTELLLEGGKRNKETAELIFNDHVQPNL